MTFDFEKFARITASVYPPSVYTLGRPHPPIRASQIVRICQDMPYINQENRGSYYEDVSPAGYIAMIDRHFATKYRHCDYNINHFFSGRIRELRFYEELY